MKVLKFWKISGRTGSQTAQNRRSQVGTGDAVNEHAYNFPQGRLQITA